MSFHNQEFWMGKSTGCLNDGEMTYDSSSRMESKRSHQWFMDGPEVDMFPNKKQAVEIPTNNLLSVFSSNISAWGNSSSFHSFNGNFTERLLDPDAATRTMSYENRNIPSPSADKLNVARKDDAEPFGSDSLFGLSISHTIDDPGSGLNYGGIRKVKVSEVKESENVMSVPTDHAYDRGVNNTMSNSHAYKEVANPISTSLTYSKGEDNIVSMDDTYGRMYNNFISLCQSYNKGNDSLSVGQNYKEICNTISMDQAFSKEDNNMISIAQAYNKVDDNSFSRDSIFNKGEDDTISVGHTYHKGGNDKLLVAHSYNRGESTIISFGGCDDDDTTSSVRLMSSYELLMGQPPIQNSEAMNERELVISNSDSLLTTALTSVSGHINVSKTKEDPKMSKKVPSNNFPSNVRSLLSTGMLDGVPVKYMAWSREKELRGVIKGAGYLCSCQSCNYAKVINAYEFERHAGRKTKHPNNHIYFENGKTIYGIVQELRSTPQNMLFEVIQTITGSPINQKSFRIWKESFLAATRELQRIYGNDEVKQLS